MHLRAVEPDVDSCEDYCLRNPSRVRHPEHSEVQLKTRTTTAQTPAISQPIRCASQSMPSELQNPDWSATCLLSEGHSVLFFIMM